MKTNFLALAILFCATSCFAQVTNPPSGGGGSGTVSPSTVGATPVYTGSTTVGPSSCLTDSGTSITDVCKNIHTAGGSAGVPAFSYTGAPAAATVPMMYFNIGTGTPTDFPSGGTFIGINSDGTNKNFFSLWNNGGTRLFSIVSTGQVIMQSLQITPLASAPCLSINGSGTLVSGCSGIWASPGAIGSTTPNSGAFTTVTSTLSIAVGTVYAGTPSSVAAGATISPTTSYFTLTGATTTISNLTPPTGISGAAGTVNFVSVNTQTLSSTGGSGAGQFATTVAVSANTPYSCQYGFNSTTLWYCK